MPSVLVLKKFLFYYIKRIDKIFVIISNKFIMNDMNCVTD